MSAWFVRHARQLPSSSWVPLPFPSKRAGPRPYNTRQTRPPGQPGSELSHTNQPTRRRWTYFTGVGPDRDPGSPTTLSRWAFLLPDDPMEIHPYEDPLLGPSREPLAFQGDPNTLTHFPPSSVYGIVPSDVERRRSFDIPTPTTVVTTQASTTRTAFSPNVSAGLRVWFPDRAGPQVKSR